MIQIVIYLASLLIIAGIILYCFKKEMSKDTLFDKHGNLSKKYLKVVDQTNIDENSSNQEENNMKYYTSDSIEKIHNIFNNHLNIFCGISDICIMGIMFFLTRNDNNNDEEKYISHSFHGQYNTIKKTIISSNNLLLEDFIKCHKDYNFINIYGKSRLKTLNTIETTRSLLDSLFDFIHTYKDNFDYKLNILYEIEKIWLFDGYTDYLNSLYKDINNRNNIICSHFNEFEQIFNEFGHAVVPLDYSCLLGILVKGLAENFKSISQEEIQIIIYYCGCTGNTEKFTKLYETIINCKYNFIDFISCHLESVFLFYDNQWTKSGVKRLKHQFDVLYKILNINFDISSSRDYSQRIILQKIDSIYRLNNYLELCNMILTKYYNISKH